MCVCVFMACPLHIGEEWRRCSFRKGKGGPRKIQETEFALSFLDRFRTGGELRRMLMMLKLMIQFVFEHATLGVLVLISHD